MSLFLQNNNASEFLPRPYLIKNFTTLLYRFSLRYFILPRTGKFLKGIPFKNDRYYYFNFNPILFIRLKNNNCAIFIINSIIFRINFILIENSLHIQIITLSI